MDLDAVIADRAIRALNVRAPVRAAGRCMARGLPRAGRRTQREIGAYFFRTYSMVIIFCSAPSAPVTYIVNV